MQPQGERHRAKPILVAVADDEVTRCGLRCMLDPHADRVALVELNAAQSIDLLVCDPSTSPAKHPDISRLAALPNVHSVVVFSWNPDPSAMRSALDRGARGYLLKSLNALELVLALEKLSQRQTEPSALRASAAAPAHDLTERQAEIVGLIAAGLSNAAIAEKTFLSPNTVKTYIRAAYRKMGVTRRSQAVLWAHHHGLVDRKA